MFNYQKLDKKASGFWLEILNDIIGDEKLNGAISNVGRHVTCPFHNGKQDFRFFNDSHKTGRAICSCGNFTPVELIVRMLSCTPDQAIEMILKSLDKINISQNSPSYNKSVSDSSLQIEKILSECTKNSKRVIKYFVSRGIEVSELPEDLLCHKSLNYYEDSIFIGKYKTMIAPFRSVDGDIVALHKTYLSNKVDGKARVETPKKFSGVVAQKSLNGTSVHLDPPAEIMAVSEGIETAMSVRSVTRLNTWAAGSANLLGSMKLPAEVKKVYIWADNDKNGTGKKYAEKLAARFLQENREVAILYPEIRCESESRDWNDVLVQDGNEAILEAFNNADWYLLNDEVTLNDTKNDYDKDIEEIIEELNSTYFIVDVGSDTVIAEEYFNHAMNHPDIKFLNTRSFNLKFKNRKTSTDDGDEPVAKIWLDHPKRRQYSNILFAPGIPTPEGCYNLFQGFPIEPMNGDCSLYWNHVKEIISNHNDKVYEYIRKWIAHIFQRPWELPETAIVLRGKQGTGKGFFVNYLQKLLGRYAFTAHNLRSVTGTFNGHLKNLLLIHANEAIWGGNKKEEGVLKGLITDPLVSIEHKGIDAFQVRNYKRLIVSSNESWCIPMGIDDRRFLVLDVSDTHKEEHEYFNALYEQMENGGLNALMFDLMNESLEGFNTRALPVNYAGFDIKLKGAEPIVNWWFSLLDQGPDNRFIRLNETDIAFGKMVMKRVLYDNYVFWCKDNNERYENHSVFGKKIKELCPILALNVKKMKPSPGNARVYCYELPPLADCRRAFESYSKQNSDIWSESNLIK